MKYISQLKHPHIPYPTAVGDPTAKKWHEGSIKEAGCGLASCCMVVDRLTTESLSLEDCVEISVKAKANLDIGSDMTVLGPVIAEKYNLAYGETSDKTELLNHLKNGGAVVANVGGDHDGYKGLFSKGGHYIALLWANEDEICVLDPSWKQEKSDAQDVIREDGDFVYCSLDLIAKETENRTPSYYLFKRK